MISSYIALLNLPEARGQAWNASFPDLPGCVTNGRNFEDAINNAWDALAVHLEGLRTFGQPFPKPRTYDELMALNAIGARCIPAQIDTPAS